MAISGRIWSFTDAREWSNAPGGCLSVALNVIRELVERHGDQVHFVVTDLDQENVGSDGRFMGNIGMEVVVAPGNPQIEQKLADLGLEYVGYRPTTHEVSAKSLTFLGEPEGNGLDWLKSELRDGLAGIGEIRAAYLSRVQFAEDSRIRLALCVESTLSSKELATEMASMCSLLLDPSAAMEIFFWSDLPLSNWQQLQGATRPFYERPNRRGSR